MVSAFTRKFALVKHILQFSMRLRYSFPPILSCKTWVALLILLEHSQSVAVVYELVLGLFLSSMRLFGTEKARVLWVFFVIPPTPRVCAVLF